MKKTLVFFVLLTILTRVSSTAVALGKRIERSPRSSFRLTLDKTVADSLSVLSFQDDRILLAGTENSLLFLDSSGQTVQRIEKPQLGRIFHSQNEQFTGIQEISSPQVEPGTEKSISFSLYDRAGVRLWTWQTPLGDDDMVPSFYISNSGRVATVKPREGQLIFLDRKGSTEKTLELFRGAVQEMERPVACAFSADGNRLAVNTLYRHSTPGDEMTPREKGQSFLFLFDEKGNELWRQPLELEIADQVVISPHGETIAAGAFSVRGSDVVERITYLYDGSGKLLSEVASPFRFAVFSSNGDRLLMGQKSNLWLAETATGRILWENILPSENGQIRAVDLSPDGSLALAETASGRYHGTRFFYAPAQAILFDDRGETVWQGSYPEDTFDRPVARFLPDGSRFLLAFQNRYLIYEKEE